MGIKTIVFASKSERLNFIKLSRQWNDKYNIYPNLPFLLVFDKEDLFDFTDPFSPKPFTLDDKDFNRLKKTSIDYTICDQNDKPIICIEFDGLQNGFNYGIHYHTKKRQSDAWRREITELKLKVAHGSLFPFIVVGTDLFKDIDKDIQLTILDGIIGEVISRILIKEKLRTGTIWEEYGYTEEQFNELDDFTRKTLIEDYALDVEISTQFENNPIWKKSAELTTELQEHYESYEIRSLQDPPSDSKTIGVSHIHEIQRAKRVGTEVTLHTKNYGSIVGRIMIPNYGTGAIFSGLTEELAMINALLKLKKTN